MVFISIIHGSDITCIKNSSSVFFSKLRKGMMYDNIYKVKSSFELCHIIDIYNTSISNFNDDRGTDK